jgi:hypothetical protein
MWCSEMLTWCTSSRDMKCALHVLDLLDHGFCQLQADYE